MAARPLVNDALWRCLCPSFTPASLYKTNFPRCRPKNTLRCASARLPLSTASTKSDSYNNNLGHTFKPSSRNDDLNTTPRMRRPRKKEAPSLVLLPTGELYERLRYEAAAGRHHETMNIIKILIKDRGERPNARLYAAMLHSFVSPQDGTAGKVRKVLEEMREMGVDLDAPGCHGVLEALAVHPDYLLREEVLAYMRERWFTLTDRGHNMVVAGLLRDRLFEQAIQKIEDMGGRGIKVHDWLLDMAIWIMLDYREIEEAWGLMVVRTQAERTAIGEPLWAQFLDTAAKLFHDESVSEIWTSRVAPGYLKPATGTCVLVLELAARRGDINLATDVFRILAARDTTLTSLHYETLMQAYLNADDLPAALSIVRIMAESATKLDLNTLYPLFNYLKQDAERPVAAFEMLRNMEATGAKIPTVAVNACLRACVERGDLEHAIEIYKALHTVCVRGPDTSTFNILFQGCSRQRRKALAMFLAGEMMKLKVRPDALTYDRLILVCCEVGDLEDALAYYEEMRVEGWYLRKGTVEKLVRMGWERGDGRVKDVVRDLERGEMWGGVEVKQLRRLKDMVGGLEESVGVRGQVRQKEGGVAGGDDVQAEEVGTVAVKAQAQAQAQAQVGAL